MPSTGRGNLGGAIAAGAAGGAAAEFLRGSGAGERPGLGDRPGSGERPGTGDRPGVGDRPGIEDRPGVGDRPLTENRPDRIENRQDLQDNRLERRDDRPLTENRPDRIENRQDLQDNRMERRDDRPLTDNRPERIENRQDWQDNRLERRDEIRDQVQDNHPRLDFWSDYPNWAAWRINAPYRWATWGALTGWVGYGWGEPAYYSYGENVYYEGDTVYYGADVTYTAEEYAQQAETIAESAPEIAPDQAEWLPLGVFALTPDGQASGPDPSLFLQLAISKEGAISGTLHNSATATTQTVEGMADKGSQRVAWNITGKPRPIMETGIANLTEDTAPALIHFADGQTQQWLMVRLEEPAADSTPPPAGNQP